MSDRMNSSSRSVVSAMMAVKVDRCLLIVLVLAIMFGLTSCGDNSSGANALPFATKELPMETVDQQDASTESNSQSSSGAGDLGETAQNDAAVIAQEASPVTTDSTSNLDRNETLGDPPGEKSNRVDFTDSPASRASLSEMSPVAPAFVKQQLSFPVGGGGISEDDFCYADPEPNHTSLIVIDDETAVRRRYHASYRSNWPDISICGLSDAEAIQISLVGPDGRELVSFNKPVTRATWDNSTAGRYCCPIREIGTYEFAFGDPEGNYKVVIESNNEHIEHSFILQRPQHPVIYYSRRLAGYVLSGFWPNERVLVLKYRTTPHTTEFEGSMGFELDDNGTGLLKSEDPSDPSNDIASIVLHVIGSGSHVASTSNSSLPLDYDLMIQIDPTNATAYYLRAASKMARGTDARASLFPVRPQANASALADLTKAIELSPNSSEFHFVRALAQTDYEAAASDLTEAIAINPMDASYYFHRAGVFERLEKYDLAAADYSVLIGLLGDDYWVPDGNFYRQPGIEWLSDEAGSVLYPEDPYFQLYRHILLGAVSYELSRYEFAIEQLGTAIGLAPNNERAYFLRARAYSALNMTTEALTDLEHVLRITNDPWLRSQSQQLFDELRPR